MRVFTPRVLVILVLCIGVSFVGLLFCAGSLYDYQDSVSENKFPNVDVLVCLSGGRGRILSASNLWYDYYKKDPDHAPYLFISGMGKKSDFQAFSKQVKAEVLEALPREKVILEIQSTNTEENAERFISYQNSYGWKRVLLVTSTYHMKRSLLIFRNKFRDPLIQFETYSTVQEPFQKGEWYKNYIGIEVTFSEYLKWLFYRVLSS